MPTAYEWDLFISYAREDILWVQTQLFEPLQHWRTEAGGPVRVFMDVESMKAGANWMKATAGVIAASRTVVGVYTTAFFASDNCQFEWIQAVGRDPMGARGLVFPVMIEDVADTIPREYTQLHSIDTRRAGWFDRLVERLRLKQAAHIQELRFLSGVGDVNVNQTLPEVRVSTSGDGPASSHPELITLFSEQGGLRGTLAAKCQDGVAVFSELFVGTPLPSTRLVATAPGCAAGFSSQFTVTEEKRVAVKSEDPLLSARGEAVFFESPDTVAIVDDASIGVFDLTGRLMGRHSIQGRPRLVHRTGSGLLVATWNGDVVWVGSNGQGQRWALPRRDGFSVCADAREGRTSTPDEFYAAAWSGDVYRLTPQGEIEPVLRHPGGVQAMCWSEDRLVICDLEGCLCVYQGELLQNRFPIDRVVRALKPYNHCVVIAGHRHVYQYSIARAEPFAQECRFELRFVLAERDRLVAVGADGKGVIFGQDLALQPFRGMVGALPTSASWDATFCVLRNTDNTYTLLDQGRMAFQHNGPLAVSPDSSRFAVSSERGVRILSADAFLQQARQVV